MTTPAAAGGPSPTGTFLEKLGGEALVIIVAEAREYEAAILEIADTAIKNGETNLGNALVAGFKAKVPLVGASAGAAIATAVEGLDPTIDGALKTGFDSVLDLLSAEAAKLEAA